MKRAVIIVTDADTVGYDLYYEGTHYVGNVIEVDPSEQLLADLRTLTEFPRGLALTFEDPRLRYADVQVSVDDWEDAEAAAARVREWLPKEDVLDASP